MAESSTRTRRSRRPNPESGYAMWIGNVPSDATEQEIRNFIVAAVLYPYTLANAPHSAYAALPTSVHVMAYTHCAFANFQNDIALTHAIAACSWKSLRPWELPYLPKLICKVGTLQEELTSGVNVQRHSRMHVNWVRKMKQKSGYEDIDAGYESGNSTDSELLTSHFPVRYFILKSATQVRAV